MKTFLTAPRTASIEKFSKSDFWSPHWSERTSSRPSNGFATLKKEFFKKSFSEENHLTNRFAARSLWVNLGLIAITLIAIGLCSWLFMDIRANQKQLQMMLLQYPHDMTVLEGIQAIHEHEIWLDLLLIIPILILCAILLGFVSFYFRAVGKLKEVRSIDNYILQSITRGVLTINQGQLITSCNRAMQDILGLDRDGCRLRPIDTVLKSDNPILQMFLEAGRLADSQEMEQEIAYIRPDGKTLPLRVTISDLHDDKGRSLGSIILVKDLAPIRSLEEKIRRQERFTALGHLTRRIIHEIRNPLSAMDMNLQLLHEYLEDHYRPGPDEKVRRYFNIAFSELRRLDAILQNTRMSVDPPVMETSRIDLHQVIQEVVMKMQAQIELAGHRLILSQENKPAYIMGDRNLLIQVFFNLIKNSLEAMSDKKGRLQLSTSVNNRKQIVIKVEDNGRGIDWQNLPRIFDPYFTTKAKGAGLGLSIVHNIVTQHGGDINVGSWVGEGTIFELYFPLAENG